MRPYITLLLFALMALLNQSCASRQKLVLDTVGPNPNQRGNSRVDGTLVVFSGLDVNGHFSDLPYRRFYSDYKIYSNDGSLLQAIQNRAEPLGGPKEVQLHPGNYKVKAHANGYGDITVPVKIVASRITTVHLEGGGARVKEADSSRDSVSLPDGQIVGWKASAESSP